MISSFKRVIRSLKSRLEGVEKADRGEVPDTLAWISIPRSGSTYLCDLLDSHPGIHSCFEVFHRKRVHCREPEALLEYLNEKHSKTFTEIGDKDLIEFSHNRPQLFLEALRELSGNRLLSYKVFPRHLSDESLRANVLADRATKKILFKRDYLSAYVSREKALKKNAWEFADTSGIKVTLDAEAFQEYVSNIERWFSNSEDYLRKENQKYAVVHYEDLMKMPSDRERLESIVDSVRSTGVALAGLDEIDLAKVSVERKKQDRSSSLGDKIENFDEFRAGLKRLDLERFLGSEA